MGDVLYAATQFGTRTTVREEARGRSTVLLVDPDPAALAAMDQALRDQGFVTATAFDSFGALAASQRVGTLNLLVTNVQTAPMHAVELADALRRHHPGLQVLYITTSEDELFEERLLSGDDDVIEKPFSGGELVEAVSSLLR